MNETLTKWHIEHCGPLEEFGYEELIPLFKAEKWDPDALVEVVKDNETINLANQQPARVKAMSAAWGRWAENAGLR